MFNKTVDSITKVFTQAIADLTALEDRENLKLKIVYGTRLKLDEEEAIAVNEINRAQAVRTKLQALTSI